MKINKEITDYDIRMVREIERFFDTEAGRYFRSQLALEREHLIMKGKKNRENEDRAYYWAELDGYDLAMTKHDRMKKDMESKLKAKNVTAKYPFKDLGGVIKNGSDQE